MELATGAALDPPAPLQNQMLMIPPKIIPNGVA
jgi:hypothetical protein